MSPEILLTLWNPTVCHGVHNSSPLVPVLSQINPVHALPSTPFTTFSLNNIYFLQWFHVGFIAIFIKTFGLSMEKLLINIRDVTHFHIPSNLRLWFSMRFLSFRFLHKAMHALPFFPIRATFSACFAYLCNKAHTSVLLFRLIFCSVSFECSLQTSAICQ